MSDTMPPAPGGPPQEHLFAERTSDRSLPVTAIAIAGTVVALVVAVLLLLGHRGNTHAGAAQPLDPYASSVRFSGLQMSQSDMMTGGKLTYIDGTVTNTGAKTLTGATVQVFFANDVQLPPQIETVPVQPVRMREPEVDLTTLAAAPLAPGQSTSFRLIFDNINANWNQSLPVLHLVHASTR